MSDPFNPCPIDRGDTCSECPLGSDPQALPVSGHGRRTSRDMFIGEGPAYNETREGIPFVGVTGDEYNGQYLLLAGTSRPRVYTTNASKCWDRKRKGVPDARVYACAAHHLQREIDLIQPENVILMGASANLLRGPDISVELEHGRTVRALVMGHLCNITTTIHPAAGLHNTAVMRDIQEDFRCVGRQLKMGFNPWPLDLMAGRYLFAEATSDKEFAFEPPRDDGPIGVDTELLGLNPWQDPLWCLSYSTAPNNGYLIRAGDTEALRRFNDLIKGRLVALHKAPFDLPILDRMGVCPSRYVDTQILVYNRGYFGHAQALKSLGYRLLGVRMKEFAELVRPYASEALIAYLSAARELTYKHPGGRKRTVEARIDAFIKKCNEGADAICKWSQWDAPNKGLIKGVIARAMDAPPPRLTIDLVPFQEAMEYACLDANVTRRVYQYLEALELGEALDDSLKVARADVDV